MRALAASALSYLIPNCYSTLERLRAAMGKRQNINSRHYWNQIWSREGAGSRDMPELHDAIIDLVPENCEVIDLGCGNGQLLRKLAQRKKARCTGLDFSEEGLKCIRAFNSIRLIQARLPRVPCRSNCFDCAICSETLEHLDRPQATIREMHRIVRDSGLIIFSVPDGCVWGKGGEHVCAFKPTDCLNLLRPYVRHVHLTAMVTSDGYAYQVCWGQKSERPAWCTRRLRGRAASEAQE